MTEPTQFLERRAANLLPPQDNAWHMKKEIQLGHVITTLSLVLTGLFFITKMDQRIALLEDKVMAQHDRDERQDKAANESAQLLRAAIERMDNKLDRLLEAKHK